MRRILLASIALPLLMSPAFSQAVAPSPAAPSPTSPTTPPSVMAPATPPRANTAMPPTTQPTMPTATTITPSSPTTATTQPTIPTVTTITPSSPTTAATLPPGGSPGANSFTEAQARTRLEENGYSAVSALTKDADGIWRGTATKASKSVQVGVDYKGIISGG